MRSAYRAGMAAAIALLSTLASAQMTAPPVAAAAAVPAEAFAELPPIEGAKLSPDGTRFAAKIAVAGRQYFAIVPLLADGGKPLMTPIAAGLDVNWWRWVGDGWLALGVGATQNLYGTEVYVTRLLGVSADLKKVNRIDWRTSGIRADTVIWSARDGTPRLLLSRQTGIDTETQYYPSVFSVDLATGRSKEVVHAAENVWDWYADAAGTVRAGIRFDDDRRRTELLYRGDGKEGFRSIAVQRRGDAGGLLTPVVFRADGSALAIDDADGRDAVYELSLPDLKLGKRLFGTERYDVDSVFTNAAGDDLAGVGLTEQADRIEWFDPEMKELQAAADKAVGGRRARFVSWNANRTVFLVEVGNPSQAGALYYWNIGTGSMTRLEWQNRSLKNRILSPVKTIRYPARDGTEVEAILTLPRGHEAKDLPLIVLPHGGPFARDSESWDWWTQYLAESGYAVIQPNYRGSSGYGTAFARKGEGQWGLAMQDDLDDAVAWAAKQGIVDPKRVCMIGASYGGYAAMRAAQRGGGLYRCAVSYAGVSDLAAMRSYDSRFLGGKTRADWLKRQAPDFHAISPRFAAAAFSVPILLVHGREDKRVPVRQSRMMADALKIAGKPYDYIEQPLADHHFTRSEDRLEFLKAMKAFLDRYNPA